MSIEIMGLKIENFGMDLYFIFYFIKNKNFENIYLFAGGDGTSKIAYSNGFYL